MVQYTDGVNEAQNDAQEEFGTDRFVELLKSCAGSSPAELSDEVLRQHREFVGEAPQYDDITLLAMKWRGLTVDNQAKPQPRTIHAG